MRNGAVKRGVRHELPLPFKNLNISFPNNEHMVKGRLMSLKRQLKRDPEKCRTYKETMSWIIANFAQKADTSRDVPGKVWRVPHHGVVHPKKKKFRVVFDASATYLGFSLNNELLPRSGLGKSHGRKYAEVQERRVCFDG